MARRVEKQDLEEGTVGTVRDTPREVKMTRDTQDLGEITIMLSSWEGRPLRLRDDELGPALAVLLQRVPFQQARIETDTGRFTIFLQGDADAPASLEGVAESAQEPVLA